MNTTTVTTPNELEIRVERIFDAPRGHVFSVWTDPKLIPEWWGDGTVVEEMDVRPGGTYHFRTALCRCLPRGGCVATRQPAIRSGLLAWLRAFAGVGELQEAGSEAGVCRRFGER